MTADQIRQQLAALSLALGTRGFPYPGEVTLMLWLDGAAVVFEQRDGHRRYIKAATVEGALAAAANWINDAPLWTAADVRREAAE